jgi:hypothetical protein
VLLTQTQFTIEANITASYETVDDFQILMSHDIVQMWLLVLFVEKFYLLLYHKSFVLITPLSTYIVNYFIKYIMADVGNMLKINVNTQKTCW